MVLQYLLLFLPFFHQLEMGNKSSSASSSGSGISERRHTKKKVLSTSPATSTRSPRPPIPLPPNSYNDLEYRTEPMEPDPPQGE